MTLTEYTIEVAKPFVIYMVLVYVAAAVETIQNRLRGAR